MCDNREGVANTVLEAVQLTRARLAGIAAASCTVRRRESCNSCTVICSRLEGDQSRTGAGRRDRNICRSIGTVTDNEAYLAFDDTVRVTGRIHQTVPNRHLPAESNSGGDIQVGALRINGPFTNLDGGTDNANGRSREGVDRVTSQIDDFKSARSCCLQKCIGNLDEGASRCDNRNGQLTTDRTGAIINADGHHANRPLGTVDIGAHQQGVSVKAN